MTNRKAGVLLVLLLSSILSLPAAPIAAPVGDAPVTGAMAAAPDVLLPWEEGEAPNHGGWHWCGNNYCPEVQECGDYIAEEAGCDGFLDALNPICLGWMAGTCLACGEFSDSCYPDKKVT